jgi:protein DGCR14
MGTRSAGVRKRKSDCECTHVTKYIPRSTTYSTLEGLSDKAAKDIRARAGRLKGSLRAPDSVTPRGSAFGQREMPPPARTPARGALTPAARRLLDRMALGGAGARWVEAMDHTAGWDAKKDLSRVPTPSPVTRRAA